MPARWPVDAERNLRTKKAPVRRSYRIRYLDGAPGRNRTADLRFTKPLLYQLSYKGASFGYHI